MRSGFQHVTVRIQIVDEPLVTFGAPLISGGMEVVKSAKQGMEKGKKAKAAQARRVQKTAKASKKGAGQPQALGPSKLLYSS